MARSAGVERHVTFAGLVDNALVARYCAAADLFVLPSLLEALPTVAVEALACGTPVVSSDNPGRRRAARRVRRRRRGGAEGAAGGAGRRDRRGAPAEAPDASATQAIVEQRFRADAVARAVLRDLRGSGAPDDADATRARRGGRAARGAARRGVGGALLRLASGAGDRVRSRSAAGIVSGVYPPERDDASGLTFAWTGADVGAAAAGSRPRQELDARSARPRRPRRCRATIRRHVPRRRRDAGRRTARRPEFQDVRVTIPAAAERRGLTLGAAQLEDVRARSRRSAAARRDAGSAVADAGRHRPGAAPGAVRRRAVSSAAMGAAIALLGRHGRLRHRRRGAAQRRRRRRHRARLRSVHRLSGHGRRARRSGSRWRWPACRSRPGHWRGAAAAQYRAVRRRVLGRRAVPEAARAAPSRTCRSATRCSTRTGSRACSAATCTSRRSRRAATRFPTRPGLYVFAVAVRRAGAARRRRHGAAAHHHVRGRRGRRPASLPDRRQGVGHRLAAAMAVAHLPSHSAGSRASSTTGNLTNAFAQSVAVGALALMASAPALERLAATALLALVLAVAYLSHTSTLAILFVATLATALLFWWRGGPSLRSPAARDRPRDARRGGARGGRSTTRTSWTPTARSSRASGTRPRRRRPTPAAARSAIGCGWCRIPSASTSARRSCCSRVLGGVELARGGARDRLTLALAGWMLSCAVFLVDRRPDAGRHAALPRGGPGLAIAAGYGAAWAWCDGWPRHRTLAPARVFGRTAGVPNRGGARSRHSRDVSHNCASALADVADDRDCCRVG